VQVMPSGKVEDAVEAYNDPIRMGRSKLSIRDAVCWLATAGCVHVEGPGPYQNHLGRSRDVSGPSFPVKSLRLPRAPVRRVRQVWAS
jgi:hypothetical protein